MKTDYFSKTIIVITSILLVLTFAVYFSACSGSDDSSCYGYGERCASTSQCCDDYVCQDDPFDGLDNIYYCL